VFQHARHVVRVHSGVYLRDEKDSRKKSFRARRFSPVYDAFTHRRSVAHRRWTLELPAMSGRQFMRPRLPIFKQATDAQPIPPPRSGPLLSIILTVSIRRDAPPSTVDKMPAVANSLFIRVRPRLARPQLRERRDLSSTGCPWWLVHAHCGGAGFALVASGSYL